MHFMSSLGQSLAWLQNLLLFFNYQGASPLLRRLRDLKYGTGGSCLSDLGTGQKGNCLQFQLQLWREFLDKADGGCLWRRAPIRCPVLIKHLGLVSSSQPTCRPCFEWAHAVWVVLNQFLNLSSRGSNSERAVPRQVKLIEISSAASPTFPASPAFPASPGLAFSLPLFVYFFFFSVGFIFCCFSSWTNLSGELIWGYEGEGLDGGSAVVWVQRQGRRADLCYVPPFCPYLPASLNILCLYI